MLKDKKIKAVKDGIVRLDDEENPLSSELGFTALVFEEASYLWKKGHCLYISAIMVRPEHQGKGHFSRLVRRALDLGFIVKVPTALPQMERILKKWGFRTVYERNPYGDRIEVYYRSKGMD